MLATGGRRWFRRLAWSLAAVVAVLAALACLATFMFFTSARLVSLLEKKFNCRAAVASVHVQWLGNPSRLEIRGLELYPRDAMATDRVALENRTAPSSAPLVTAEQLKLDVAFASLLVGRIDIRELSGKGIRAVATELEGGDSDLELLFADPDEVEELMAEESGREERKKRGDHDFTVDTFPLPTHCRAAFLEDFQLAIVLPRRDVRVDLEKVSLRLTDVDISRHDVRNHNHAELNLDGTVRVTNLETGQPYGTALLRGFGDVTPFDAATRIFMPEVFFQVDLLEGSNVDAIPLLDKVASKLRKLEDYGVALGDLTLQGDLKKEALVRFRYKDEVFTLTDASRFEFADFTLSLAEGSWYDADDDQHRFETGIRSSEALTEAALARVERLVEEKLKLPAKPFRELIGRYLLENDRLQLEFVSEGELGSPEVTMATPLPSLEEILKELSKNPLDLIRSFLD